jgi:hypothetical protein
MMKLWKLPTPKTIKQIIEEEIYQAQMDLLRARASAEHWTAMSNMLSERVNRLKTAALLEK